MATMDEIIYGETGGYDVNSGSGLSWDASDQSYWHPSQIETGNEWWNTPLDLSTWAQDTQPAGYDAAGNWLGATGTGGMTMEEIAAAAGSGWEAPDWLAGSGGGDLWSSLKNLTLTYGGKAADYLTSKPGMVLGGLGALSALTNREPEVSTSTRTATAGVAPWLEQAGQRAIQTAEGIPDYVSPIDRAGFTYGMTDVEPYMSPFVQAVWAPQAQRMSEDFAQEMQGLRAKGGADAWGTRGALLENLAQERFGKRFDEAEAGMLQNAFANAQGLAGADIGRRWEDYSNLYESPFKRQGAINATLQSVKAPTTATQTDTTVGPKPDLLSDLSQSLMSGYGMQQWYNQNKPKA